jgi:hypothetical protein
MNGEFDRTGPIRVRRGLGAVLILGVLGMTSGTEARAQFGFGWGFGMGYHPYTSEYLNQRSLQAGNAAFAARGSIMPQPNSSPLSYMSRVRDNNFLDRYDPVTRQRMEDAVARNPSRPRRTVTEPAATPAAAPAETAARPPLALASFFNAYGDVQWPAESPVHGDLAEKRAKSDTASKSVLEELKRQGIASMSTATEARNLLIDYGRPALTYLVDHTPLAIAEGFHRYLLGLYDALGRAALPEPTPGAAPGNRPRDL